MKISFLLFHPLKSKPWIPIRIRIRFSKPLIRIKWMRIRNPASKLAEGGEGGLRV